MQFIKRYFYSRLIGIILVLLLIQRHFWCIFYCCAFFLQISYRIFFNCVLHVDVGFGQSLHQDIAWNKMQCDYCLIVARIEIKNLPVSSILSLQPVPICFLNSSVFGSRRGFSNPFTPILKRATFIIHEFWQFKVEWLQNVKYLKPSKPSSEPLTVKTGARAYALAIRRFLSRTIT